MRRCKNILIIEDENGIREILCLALELEGYTVFTASNGKEGLELLPKMSSPCLILLDLMMPMMNGWEFMEAISRDAVLASIPVVVVSASADSARELNVQAVVKKPVNLDVLYKVVRKYCD